MTIEPGLPRPPAGIDAPLAPSAAQARRISMAAQGFADKRLGASRPGHPAPLRGCSTGSAPCSRPTVNVGLGPPPHLLRPPGPRRPRRRCRSGCTTAARCSSTGPTLRLFVPVELHLGVPVQDGQGLRVRRLRRPGQAAAGQARLRRAGPGGGASEEPLMPADLRDLAPRPKRARGGTGTTPSGRWSCCSGAARSPRCGAGSSSASTTSSNGCSRATCSAGRRRPRRRGGACCWAGRPRPWASPPPSTWPTTSARAPRTWSAPRRGHGEPTAARAGRRSRVDGPGYKWPACPGAPPGRAAWACWPRSTRWCGSGTGPADVFLTSSTGSRSTCRRPSAGPRRYVLPFLLGRPAGRRVDLEADRAGRRAAGAGGVGRGSHRPPGGRRRAGRMSWCCWPASSASTMLAVDDVGDLAPPPARLRR